MGEPWEKPAFHEVSVNGECTAYVGALQEPDLSLSVAVHDGVAQRSEESDAEEKQN